MRAHLLGALFWLSLCLAATAHQVIMTDENGLPLMNVTLLPEWSVLASSDGLELVSGNSRTRLHCLELRSCHNIDEAKVFLRTLRDGLTFLAAIPVMEGIEHLQSTGLVGFGIGLF